MFARVYKQRNSVESLSMVQYLSSHRESMDTATIVTRSHSLGERERER